MAKIQILRALVNQRLTAAAEEIFGVVERTIAEYEEEVSRSKQEIERQRKLLDAALKPEIKLHTADSQHLFVCEEEGPPEQEEERSPSPAQGESPRIKEEREELWSSDKEDLLQSLDEADTVCVRNEHGQGDQIQPLHIYLSSSVEDGEDDLVTNTITGQVKSEPGGEEDCIMLEPDTGRQPLSTGCSAAEVKESDSDGDCRETEGSHVGFNALKLMAQNAHIDPQEMTFRELPRRQFCAPPHEGFSPHCNDDLMKNVEMQGDDTDPDCDDFGPATAESMDSLGIDLEAGKESDLSFSPYQDFYGDGSLQCHSCLKVCHTEHDLKKHLRVHTGEKPFRCVVCGKEFNQKENLRAHFKTHTGERPFKCCVCRKRFSLNGNLKRHMMIHTGEKPFGCSVCDKRFNQRGTLKQHMNTHVRESFPLQGL